MGPVSRRFSGQWMPKYSDRAVSSRWSRPAARPRRPVMPGRAMGNRHWSSRPPAARTASAHPGHHGAADFAMGSTISTRVPRACGGDDFPQQRRPRVFRKLVGGEGRDDGRGARRQSHAREVAAADVGVEAEGAARPPRLVGRPRMALDAKHAGIAGRTPAPTPRRPRRFRSRDRRSRSTGGPAASRARTMARTRRKCSGP